MPRFRRRKVRNRGGRKDTSFVQTVGQIARKGYKIAKFVKSLVNTEIKFLDTNGALAPTNSTAQSCVWLSDINEGSGPSGRTGQSILAKAVYGRISATIHASATTTFIRFIMFIDTNPSAASALPVMSSVLQSSTDPTIAPLSMDFPGRFRVLKDKVFTLSQNGPQAAFMKWKYIYNDKDGYESKMKWDATGDAITDKRQNHLFLLVISDQATNTPALQYFTRLRYIDN